MQGGIIRFITGIGITLAVSTAFFFGPITVDAANVPCPVIRGVQTAPNGTRNLCIFPSTFTTTSAGLDKFNTGQRELNAFNGRNFGPRDNTASDSGNASGNTGDTDTTNPSGSTTGEPRTKPASTGAKPGCSPENVAEKLGTDNWFAVGLGGALCGFGEAIIGGFGSIFSMKNIFWVMMNLAWFLLMIAQVFMGFAAWWLDGAIYYTVIKMGYFINHEVSAEGIQFVWALLRDLTNVLIIGGFVAVGISTILQVSQYAADKFLARLIIAALLVNFSYFIAGAIIDSANYISIQIYSSDLIQNNCAEDSAKGTITGPIRLAQTGLGDLYTSVTAKPGKVSESQICGFARSLVGYTGMTSWDKIKENARSASYQNLNTIPGMGGVSMYDPACLTSPGKESCKAKSDPDTNYYFLLTLLSLMGAGFALLLGWVFMKAALYIIARFAVLIILLVTSPLGVGGAGVPYIGQFVGTWWKALISQAIFAPVFLFLMGVSLMSVKQFSTVFASDGKVPLADAFFAVQHSAGNGIFTSLLPLFINYFLAVVFIYVSYLISSQIANSVSEFKGIYDFASKRADGLFKTPLSLTQRFAGTPLQAGAEALASRGYLGARSASIGLQYMNEFMTGKKREGSVGEEVNKRIDEKTNNRYANENSSKTEGYLGIRKGGALWQTLGRTKEKTDALKDDGKNLTPEELLRKYGMAGVLEMSRQKLISDETLKKIRESNAFSKNDKSQITNTYFSEFMKAFKDAEKNNTSESWQAAAEKFDNMTDLERQLLLTERKELRDNKEFYGRVKSDNFNSMLKGKDAATQKAMRDNRIGVLKTDLGKTTTEQQGRDILDRMSKDEKAGLTLETVEHLANTGALSAADAHHIHQHGTEDVRKFLAKHPKYSKNLVGPGVDTTDKNDEKKDEPSEEKGEDKK